SNGSAAMAWGLRRGTYGLKENVFINAHEVEKEIKLTGRVFTDAEIKLIWDHAPEGHARPVARMLWSTGCRRAEVGNMCWSEIAGDRWSIPIARLKNARTRIKLDVGPHRLKLMPMMKEIIDGVPRRVGRDQLFGSRGKGYTGWSHEAKSALDKVIEGE